MSYYPEPDSHIRDKVKVVLELSTKKELNNAATADTSNLAAERDFIVWKAQVTNQMLIKWLMLQLV